MGYVHKILIWPYEQMVYVPSTCPRKWHSYIVGFWCTDRSPHPDQETRPYDNQQKKRICKPQNKTERMWKEG